MGVWIETHRLKREEPHTRSHPVWVCGLKLKVNITISDEGVSHPVWVCGLKLAILAKVSKRNLVTPCMGVWIETRSCP